MQHTPNVDVIVHTLRMIGLQVHADHIPAFLSWSGVIGAALLSGWFLLAKARADRRTLSVTQLLERVDKLTAKVDHLEGELRAARTDMGLLKDDNRDMDETLKDFAGHLLNIDAWIAEGGTPPAPAQSWRIRDFMARHIMDN